MPSDIRGHILLTFFISYRTVIMTMPDSAIEQLRTHDDALPAALNDVSVETLYYRGVLPSPDQPTLAVVGTRRCSPEGERITRSLVEPLARADVIIVSGLAEGIDTAAHEATLASNGTTVAVLGTGIDNESIYPQRNVRLAERIVEQGGAVMSEYEPGTPGLKHHFPQRNRIIAALANVTLVVEAPQRSGALITAKHAQRLDRAVAAVPGSLHHPQANGCNALLEEGAHAVTSPERLADLLGVSLGDDNQIYTPASFAERELLSLLEEGPQGIDSILDQCTIPSSQVLGLLTRLQKENVIEDIGSKRYALRSEILNPKS